MFIRLVQDKEDVHNAEYLTLIFTFVLGFISCRFLVLHSLMHKAGTKCEIISATVKFWDFLSIENLLYNQDKSALCS